MNLNRFTSITRKLSPSFFKTRPTSSLSSLPSVVLLQQPVLSFSLCDSQNRYFHSSVFRSAKKKKKGGSKNEDSVDDAPALPDLSETGNRMEKRVAHLKEEYTRMHSGRVSKDMFNHVLVDAYGSKSPVPECGQVSVQAASKIVINVFDGSIASDVSKALRDCGLNLNPIVEGTTISVPIPKASKEMREDMVKVAKKAAEKTKQEIRHVRKNTLDKVKDAKGSFSEDDIRKHAKDVDALTEKYLKLVENELKLKEKDIQS